MRPDCPTLYSECGYTGESFSLCANVEDFEAQHWENQTKSIWVPEGWEATLYNDTHFDGEDDVYTEPGNLNININIFIYLLIIHTYYMRIL